ncbi:hydrophobe/amphiphile efflux-1 (HAE1) family protein [Thiothrix caldifontis]|uniref:Hydrophobe/amphiphile efflux-1 (HAE1) family protein n=1 Tax=Thiothrix caldifontis TaxID=525918 RepID=A0A1H4FUX1_9GAMM|nr:efflux RND transporter permease subunit [Thiothrix caldifontis]SEB00438.1 hydrophobe/amphiphile efflux-1 (HAE1) family protein [Thiothrix caldifontis]
MNVSAWSIRNPVPAILLFALLSFLGVKGFKALGIQNFPDIDLPTIIVNASLEGADPEQLESEVARKIENQLATITGVKHIRTTLTDSSASIATEFDIAKDTEVALNEVRNAVDTIRANLPQQMNDPIVSKVTTAGSPLITFTVASANMDEEALSWFVDNDITRTLMSVKGVGNVARVGGVNREVRIDLDPALMAGLGVTAADVSNRLGQMQQDAPGGRGDIGGGIQSVRTLGRVGTAAELGAIDIPLSNGRHVRLDQIATIRDTIAERATHALLDGKSVVGFQITRVRGASEIDVVEGVRAALATFSTAHPQVQIAEAYDTIERIQANYEGSMHLLYEGAALAILVVFLFLGNWRATLVSAAALPLAIIPTFMAMQYFGFSLNILTLLALALVVGVLVDDAIVEVENIERHLRMGKTPKQAAIEAADEIGLAVIATTFTLVAVFLPTAFMGGVPGKFFKSFGITAAVAVFFSLAVARLLTPMMAAYLLKPHPEKPLKDGWFMRTYMQAAGWCLKHRIITLVAAIVIFVASLQIVPLLPKGFVPPADTALTSVALELQPGSTLAETYATAEQARHLLEPLADVKQVFTLVGASSGVSSGPISEGGGADVRKATLTLTLTTREERSRKQTEVEAEIRQALKPLPGVRFTVGSGGAGDKMQVVLASDDGNTLLTAARAAERDLRTLQGIGNVVSGASLQRPEIHIKPDYARAAELGVSTEALGSVVRVATSGDFSTRLPKLNLPQRQIPIRVQFDKTVRADLDTIRQLRIPGRNGSVPLAAVADIKLGSGPARLDRFDRMRNVSIDVELNGLPVGQVTAMVDKLPSLQTLPPGVHRQSSGDAERMAELFGGFGGAMLIGVMLIYIVLVLLFHDFLQPITILAALPLSVGGAFVALLITGMSFSMPAVIGLLMLMGIVTKNSILLVDYAVMARERDQKGRVDALLDACHKRARPIVMTTIAMGAGMMPTALGLAADPSFRQPMAIVVIGGLLASTFLSLLVIPVVFTFIDDILVGFRKVLGKLHHVHQTT